MYTNVVGQSIPVIYRTKILKELENVLVLGKIATREYEGEIKRAGQEVIIKGRGKPTIKDYTGTVTWEKPTDSAITLRIDQNKYWAVEIDDIDEFQADYKIMDGYAADAAYQLDKTVDTHIASMYSQSAHAKLFTDTDVDTATAIGDITLIHTHLAELDVPEGNMWIVIPPWLADKLELAGIVHAEKVGGELVTNYLGRVLRFHMYVSNNLAHNGAKTDRDTYIMAGSYQAIAYCSQILKTQIFDQMEGSFENGARGLHVWGAKVVKPRELVYCQMKYAAETTI